MGKVYRNRIPYAGGGNVKECTLAQYNTWKANGQLVPNTTYDIVDAPNLNVTANDLSYDGSATTTKQAIDKHDAKEITYTGNTTNQGFLVSDIDFTAKIRMAYVTDSSTGKYFCILRPSASFKVVALVINDNLLPETNKTDYTLHVFYSDK